MKDFNWLIVDEWRGQEVYRSDDLINWEWNGLILDQSGTREDDGKIGLHAGLLYAKKDDFSSQKIGMSVVFFDP